MVLGTLSVDVRVGQVLPAERADKFVLLELASVPVHKASPLVHFVTRLLVELLLVVIVLLLKLL